MLAAELSSVAAPSTRLLTCRIRLESTKSYVNPSACSEEQTPNVGIVNCDRGSPLAGPVIPVITESSAIHGIDQQRHLSPFPLPGNVESSKAFCLPGEVTMNSSQKSSSVQIGLILAALAAGGIMTQIVPERTPLAAFVPHKETIPTEAVFKSASATVKEATHDASRDLSGVDVDVRRLTVLGRIS
jgi:hypothetical protein